VTSNQKLAVGAGGIALGATSAITAVAMPVQKISIDEHCDTKQVSFKEACEVEVLEPKVEPWEQKQVEMQALGARAQSDVDLGDGEAALASE